MFMCLNWFCLKKIEKQEKKSSKKYVFSKDWNIQILDIS